MTMKLLRLVVCFDCVPGVAGDCLSNRCRYPLVSQRATVPFDEAIGVCVNFGARTLARRHKRSACGQQDLARLLATGPMGLLRW